jgi:multiple sugar transport system ATP-binding protein
MNFLAVSPQTGANAGRIAGPGNLSLAMVASNPAGPIAEIGVRPEGLRLVAEADGRIACTLERVEDLGHEHFGYCRITDDTVWVIRLPSAPSPDQIGGPVGLDFADSAIFAFAADGKRVLLSRSSRGPAEVREP